MTTAGRPVFQRAQGASSRSVALFINRFRRRNPNPDTTVLDGNLVRQEVQFRRALYYFACLQVEARPMPGTHYPPVRNLAFRERAEAVGAELLNRKIAAV